mmetsp:Transcript_123668/g.385071  ORF Transcript_123668/g.385071 Transcript_123668/m.385071 type:complete len:276 (+) Transcript_123668:75-902(+)|eukprot:CAMPEP_0204516896 /NCGR_PEP_ID=MMETSP0661-20131031/3380_1 /ASSEMBLY_ACC=CAM_ASM_000606 /TAXON_ID=109239 /ORGANISM="Alexandrium margalefi, Strain AMGDE01CS-322" /LENGTH=275 /DNA_ID=CAMNT_0051522273 /DNA_START=80 /DNA_END=907 /DNA_ORIENTATION=-
MVDHGESIYNIIQPKQVEQEKPPMYRSRFSGQTPPTASTFHTKSTTHPAVSNIDGDLGNKPVPDKEARTFGRIPGTYKNNPADYMKKSTKNGPVPALSEARKNNPEVMKPSKLKDTHKPSVPKADEAPVMNLVTSKNFIVANAVETILAAPKKVSEGAKDYLHKEDYGKTPKYLSHIKKDIEREYDYIRQLEQQREDQSRPMVRPLDEEERKSLIEGLKAKWEQVNTEYQATTHLTKLDSFGKIKRKEKYEAELSQIEKDIEKLNRQNIHIHQAF